MRPALVLFPFVMLAACEGANEKAGAERDRAAAAAAGQNYSGDGPNERMGETLDRAERDTARATDAAADAAEAKGREIRSQAEIEADRLSEQARDIRERAEAEAERVADSARR